MVATPSFQLGEPRFTHFLSSKKKKGKQRKKEIVSKQKLLKGSHQGQNATLLVILGRLECKDFSFWPTMMAENNFQCSIYPPL